MAELMPCPCGKVPERLVVDGLGIRPALATVCGSCCHSWQIEYRNDFYPIGHTESERLAREAWNTAPRAKQEAGG